MGNLRNLLRGRKEENMQDLSTLVDAVHDDNVSLVRKILADAPGNTLPGLTNLGFRIAEPWQFGMINLLLDFGGEPLDADLLLETLKNVKRDRLSELDIPGYREALDSLIDRLSKMRKKSTKKG